MNRRSFVKSTAATAAIPLTFSLGQAQNNRPPFEGNELYEVRCYELKFRGNQKLLLTYLQEKLRNTLSEVGVNHFWVFRELSQSTPVKLWVIISYPGAQVYLQAQKNQSSLALAKGASEYHDIPPEQSIYNRFESWLLLAFDGMPQAMQPVEGASIFELRTYEGYSEDAVRRKIKMFNDEEIDLFNRTELYPVFFGEMLAGPYRPCLTYMLNFRDMEERDAHWQDFLQHPEWKAMSQKKEYANTVSNIRRVFLEPV